MKMKSISSIVLLSTLLLLIGCDHPEQDRPAPVSSGKKTVYDGLIVAMGDSLTAGLGVALEDGYPAVLEARLQEQGIHYRVVNAGVSGETSSGALARIDWIISQHPDLVILETGANDGLRGIDPGLVQQNISSIVEKLLARNIGVVLVGIKMVANMGPEYLSRFDSIYTQVASRYPVTFMPFFLEGVAMQPELNQADAIHPNERGYEIVVDHLLPFVKAAIDGINKN